MRNRKFGVLNTGVELESFRSGIFGTLLCMYSRSFRPVRPIKRTEERIGRNQLCFCGSNRKHKNCCGKG